MTEQRQRLKQRTCGDHEDVVNLFVQYLNSYAYLRLGIEDSERFDALYKEGVKEYCDIFGPEYIGDSEVEVVPLLLHDPESVWQARIFWKTSVRVMHKLVKWLHEKGYMDGGRVRGNRRKYRGTQI